LGNRANGQTLSQPTFPWAKTGQNWAEVGQSEDGKVLPSYSVNSEIVQSCPQLPTNLPAETCSESVVAHLPTFQKYRGISVGDRVRYVGRGENGLFTLKGIWREPLTIVAIKDDHLRCVGDERAEVSSPKWVTTQNIPIKDLRKV
jgi:hypothetical protein